MTRHFYNGTTWVPQQTESTANVFNGSTWIPLYETIAPPTNIPTVPYTDVPGMVANLDAANPAATGVAPADGSKLTSWKDIKTAATYTPPLAANQPTYRAATSTEPAFVKFDGANDWLTRTGTFLPQTGAWTIYAVTRLSGLGYGGIINQSSSTAVAPVAGIDLPTSGGIRGIRRTDNNILTVSTSHQIPHAWRVVSVSSPAWNTINVRSNEEAATPGTSTGASDGATTCDTTVIGGRMSYSTAGTVDVPFLGDIAMIVAYAGEHTAATRASIEQQLATRCKIVLPSQGGTLNGPISRISDDKLEMSRNYGIPATQRVTGKTLPGFHNTGPNLGVNFEIVTGPYYSTADNQVITGKWIMGNFIPKHRNVTLRNCIIFSGGDPKIDTRQIAQDTIVTIDQCELYGQLNDGGTGIGYIRYTVTNSYIHDCEDEVRLNKTTIIRNNLMCRHSNGFLTATERLHTDCVQSNGGDNADGERSYVQDNTLIAQRRNLTKGNSAIILATEGANINGVNQGTPLRHVTVEGNYLAGGSFSLYIKTPLRSGSPGPMEDIIFRNNEFRGTKPDVAVTMRSGISSDSLAGGAFVPTGSGTGDMAIPHATNADPFLTMSGNIREDGSAPSIYRWAADAN